ncbi:collagen alpha-1(I) chain-like [Lepus europaeus]|uniref:collagen alpha-1(I) chain-like n=1 Tax=Lepus europaeus TaxID=9983 RepID=UPI002B467CFE|nr:collagen alpha-1(I) chain-like [Lepus europaeus]
MAPSTTADDPCASQTFSGCPSRQIPPVNGWGQTAARIRSHLHANQGLPGPPPHCCPAGRTLGGAFLNLPHAPSSGRGSETRSPGQLGSCQLPGSGGPGAHCTNQTTRCGPEGAGRTRSPDPWSPPALAGRPRRFSALAGATDAPGQRRPTPSPRRTKAPRWQTFLASDPGPGGPGPPCPPRPPRTGGEAPSGAALGALRAGEFRPGPRLAAAPTPPKAPPQSRRPFPGSRPGSRPGFVPVSVSSLPVTSPHPVNFGGRGGTRFPIPTPSASPDPASRAPSLPRGPPPCPAAPAHRRLLHAGRALTRGPASGGGGTGGRRTRGAARTGSLGGTRRSPEARGQAAERAAAAARGRARSGSPGAGAEAGRVCKCGSEGCAARGRVPGTAPRAPRDAAGPRAARRALQPRARGPRLLPARSGAPAAPRFVRPQPACTWGRHGGQLMGRAPIGRRARAAPPAAAAPRPRGPVLGTIWGPPDKGPARRRFVCRGPRLGRGAPLLGEGRARKGTRAHTKTKRCGCREAPRARGCARAGLRAAQPGLGAGPAPRETAAGRRGCTPPPPQPRLHLHGGAAPAQGGSRRTFLKL